MNTADSLSADALALDSHLKWNPRVASRTLEETAFVLVRSSMLSLNDVGTYVWNHFRDGSTIQAAVDAVVANFETTEDVAQADILKFVSELMDKSLLVEANKEA